MRSRFLNIDYFSLALSQSRETLTFLHLPVPRLPSPPPSGVEDHLRFHSTLHVSLHIDRLPIDDALSKFLSGVLPHSIDVDFQYFEAAIPSASSNCFSSSSFGTAEDRISEIALPQEAEVVFEENEMDNRRILGSEDETEFHKVRKRTALIDNNESIYNMVKFETPELDVLLETVCFPEDEVMQMLYETSGNENNLELLKTELSMHLPCEVLESISLVEDVTSEYLTDQNAYSSEDNMSVSNLPHLGQSKFPILEVDEESLGILIFSSMEENVGSYFDNIRPLNMDKTSQFVVEGKELLGSMKYNMMEFLSDNCISKQSLVLSDMLPERNFIILLETEYVHGSWADSALLVNLVTFQEFLFLDENLFQTFEGFYNTKTLDDPETKWMFKKEFSFRNFDELIVSNEIALMDDTFKSLPVPVISDYGKMISLYVIIGEMLSNLKTLPQSASDGIYLNWDLLEEDKCNCNNYHYYQNMWAKIDLNNIDFDGKYINDGRLVFDLVFSSDTPGGCNINQSEELQKLLSDCASLPEDHTIEVASSNPLDGGSPKQGSGQQLAERNAERASLLYKSMSEVSHLDYFLNPQKATAKGNCNFAVESTDADVNVPKVTSTELKASCRHTGLQSQVYEARQENETRDVINPKERMMNPKLEEVFDFCPLEQNYDIRSSKAADEVDCFVPPISVVKSEHSHQSMESFLETVIIVNTQSVDKEMIVSRRSTYQVILAMEKGGTQVVERDLDLPVDIIISSAICLVWYDNRNVGKKATPVTEASSSLPLWVENIATNILTLLSFSFGGCFLVFEGDFNFLSTVMESSDGLYAAAASLGIDLQIFFSYSPELTNEIIVSCIKYATKLTRGLYPKMPDSVTLAESFLTKFPSINPLMAHAILSSGVTLAEFLEWSHEHRIRVLERYHVPEESITLFSAFCRFGVREDSKSIMTDCSSSVSSGPDSDRCHLYQVDYERKRKKHVDSPKIYEPCFDELLQFEPLDQVVDGFLDSSKLSKPCNPGMSKDAGRSPDLTNANLPSDLFGPKQGFNVTTTMRNPSRVSQPSCDSWNCKAPLILEQIEQPYLSMKDKELAQNDKLDTATMSKNLTWHGLSYPEKLHDDFTGEVVDLTDSPLLNKNFSFITDSLNFPSLMTETEQDLRKNKIARKLSFDNSSHPETNFSNIWRSLEDTRGEVDNNPEPNFGKEIFPPYVKHREKIPEEVLTRASKRDLQGLPFQEEMSHLSRTPLSRALQSASPLKNSPWTIAFINRIKEKSKFRQQALSCEDSAPCFGYSGNTSKVAKRRGTPIIELFTYQGSRIENIPEQKRQKQSVKALKSAEKGKYSASVLPTWTPNDKKARKTLTFARNESGSQTKLVWNDETQCLIKKFRYQTQ